MGIQVISRRPNGNKGDAIEVVVNISRPSPLGNPFRTAQFGQGRCIKMYENNWNKLMTDHNAKDEFDFIVAKAMSGYEVGLLCWCSPKKCHGDIIKQKAVEEIHRLCNEVRDIERRNDDTNTKIK